MPCQEGPARHTFSVVGKTEPTEDTQFLKHCRILPGKPAWVSPHGDHGKSAGLHPWGSNRDKKGKDLQNQYSDLADHLLAGVAPKKRSHPAALAI